MVSLPVRRLAALALVLGVATACAGPGGPGEAASVPPVTTEASPSPLPSASASADPGTAPGEDGTAPTTAPSDGPSAGGPDPSEGPGTAPGTDPAPQLTPLADGAAVGSNGPAYLRGDRQRVVVELDVQDGVTLSAGVVEHLRTVLDRESLADVEVVRGGVGVPARSTWTVAQLRAAAAASRSVAHDDDTAVLHLLVLDGAFEEDGVLGLAFDSSTAVVFPAQWSDLTTLLLTSDTIARAVTVHEVGHLLGLVGLAAPPTSDHEDPEHPGHTVDEDDVMYWAIETTLIGGLAGVPDDFGPATRADLAALRG